MNTQQKLTTAISQISKAENILIGAGAGMSQEIGLQTYWTGKNTRYGGDNKTEYGYTTIEHATEYLWYENEKAQTEYYAKVLKDIQTTLSKNTTNHYTELLEYLQNNNKNYWIITTNIDSAFKYYGYNENHIYEQHGNLLYSQCLKEPKTHGIFPTNPEFKCPECNTPSRPNTLFFNDMSFNSTRKNQQLLDYEDFEDILIEEPSKSIILEFGAGNTVANIRNHTLKLNSHYDIPGIRINPNKPIGTDGLSQILPQSAKTPIIEFTTTSANFIKILRKQT